MFGRRNKDEDPAKTGPYLVEKVVGNGELQKLLNRRDAEGYDMLWIIQSMAYGSNAGRDVVFKRRPGEGAA